MAAMAPLLSELIGLIYEAALEPARWNCFLDGLADTGNDARVTFFVHNVARPCENVIGVGRYPDGMEDYVSRWAPLDPFVHAARQVPIGRVNYHHETVPDPVLRAGEYFNDCLKPRRLGFRGVNLVLERSPYRTVRLAFSQGDNKLSRLAAPHRLITLLAPHLARAVRVHRTVTVARQTRDSAHAAMDRLDLALMLVTADGRIATMNGAAARLLDEADGMGLDRHGKLIGWDAGITALLHARIAQVAAFPQAIGVESDLLSLPRPSERPHLEVIVSPPAKTALALGIDEIAGTAMVLVCDPIERQRAPLAWLSRRFGLTPAELRLTELLIAGVALNAAAEMLVITVATARTRLKHILAKTGCHRQSDLIRLAWLAPAFRR